MKPKPENPRAHVFFDGQNLFHSAKEAFGYSYPNYDVVALANRICSDNGWKLEQVHFYTGVPVESERPFWYHFWTAKTAAMGRQGVRIFTRPVRNKREKGVDTRIAIDLIKYAHANLYDVVVVFSQDQDLSEAADEIRQVSREQNRWIKIASAFPVSPKGRNPKGINKTDWLPFDKQVYDSCIDSRDYRKKSRK